MLQAILPFLLAASANALALDRSSLYPRQASCPASPPPILPCSDRSRFVLLKRQHILCPDTILGHRSAHWAINWTIHGLWPDNCDGTYQANCDPSRAYTNISAILQAGGASDTLSYMRTYWKDYQGNDESFWDHEWAKHGTCISTLQPSCYGSSYQPQEEVVQFFQRTVSLFKGLPTYQWLAAAGITPSNTATYSLSQLQAVAKANFGYEIYWGCQNNLLNEAWYGYTTRGTVTNGEFDPAAPISSSSCPSTGIKYLPKSSSTTTSSAPSSSSTGGSGGGSGSVPSKIYLNVYANGGSSNGCLISNGKWYTSGTCATYTATASGSGYTLSTSKGPCQVSSGALSCASGLSPSTFSFDASGNLAYAGSTKFYSSSIASGSTQVTVLTTSSSNTLAIKYTAV